MTAGRDDDALTWDGDDDPTLETARPESSAAASPASGTPALPEGWSAVGKGSEAVENTPERVDDSEAGAPAQGSDADAEPMRPSMGNATLISLGVLGGVYALYAIGWLIGGLRLQGSAEYLVTDIMFQGSLWLAVLAPVLWFGTVFLLTRGARAWVRFAWLAAGVVLLLPWPFVMTGAVGQ